MLCGFKKYAVRIYISMHATLESFYIHLFRLAGWLRYNEQLHPSRLLLGVGSGQTTTTRYQLFVAAQSPWQFGETLSLSFGLQVQRFFKASSGPLGGTEALLESTFEAQGDFPWKSHCLAIQINQKNREYLSHPSFGEINIWNFSLYLLIYRPFEGSKSYQLYLHGSSTLASLGDLTLLCG